MNVRGFFLMAALGFLPMLACAAPLAPVHVVVLNRPPYYEVVDEAPRGFLLMRAKAVFAAAGVPVLSYAAMPPKRILALIEKNAAPLCSVGWFKTLARERFARYSSAIHVDRPHRVIAHRSVAVALQEKHSLLKVMDDPDLRLGLVGGYSYGTYLDAMIAARQGPTDAGAPTPARLIDKLADGQVDFALVDQEEAGYLIAASSGGNKLVPVPLQGLPPGLKRHLICSLQVSPETMAALDEAIARQGLGKNPEPSVR
jgi:uncharacterized protein (TIGR02285 family)